MRSVLATLIIGSGAVYGYAAFYGIALFYRRRQRREYLTFGLMALALMLHCAGGALLTDATSLAEGDLAVRIKIVGSVFTLAFVHHFAVQLAGVRWPRLVQLGYAYATLLSIVVVAGLATQPGVAGAPPTWGFAAAPDYLETKTAIVGSAVGTIGWVIVASSIAALAVASRNDPRAKLVLWAFIANTIAVTHDTLIHVASLRSVYLSEHAALLTVAAVSQILLDRYTRTSEELDVRTRELSSSVGELKHTEAELVKKEQLAAVGELSGLIANQVETPLQTIKLASAGMSREALSAEDRLTLLESLDEEVDRLNRLVDDLLAYARPVKPQMRPVAVAEMVTESLSVRVPEDSTIERDLDVEQGPAVIYGDGDLLRTALDNVVENAVQAMPDGGAIGIRTRHARIADSPAVVIDVRDSGDGMDAHARAHASEPFFTTRPLGTGLGLAIVERVIKMHGGELTIESTPNHGTTVSILLPVGQPTSGVTPVSGDQPPTHDSGAEARD